ncbi:MULTISPECIES: HAMP domain-containing sensor histidine kinase [Campylobacter]|uniref:HAMP domain-containing sensor histidine kinase n=1 Tax=Campylobacter TaxID=194 RepID=UPI0006880065|nr:MULTISPECIES: HAMP domain-containing sensor histidine kinase [Campylobacter]MBN7288218.1 HAMP domain-containing histidine kinase [Campylobacter curvus]MDU6827087.1 HAMP domain-containing sensor histidine kinase [Campylobacter sp.]
MLIAVISVMLYYYIRVTVFETVIQELSHEANQIITNPQKYNPLNLQNFIIQEPNQTETLVQIKQGQLTQKKPYFSLFQNGEQSFTTLAVPYINDDSYMILKKETTLQSKIVEQIFVDIIIVNATAILLVLFYALFLSRMLLLPIRTLSAKLTKLDEKFLKEIDIKSLPDEFYPLGNSINKLISRIQTFVEYQKELFVGVAHELKTPLAVMKTKNEVTLIKTRESEKYIEALRSNNEAINNMNSMISSVLEIGRQEGAQFEEPVNTDIIGFLNKLGNNFQILARAEEKNIIMSLQPEILNMKIQTTLLTHVIQNFVQNAIKFSPKDSNITILSRTEKNSFIIEVIDEGIGIDESKDLFAPFKRFGDKGGAGLGLFLAKGAAQALGGSVAIKNRKDGKSGAVSTLTLPIKIN